MALSLRWGDWSLWKTPRLRGPQWAPVAGRGALPGGARFVVVQVEEPWPPGAAVELVDGPGPNAARFQGWVDGTIGSGLVRVVLGTGCDARLCRWARLGELR